MAARTRNSRKSSTQARCHDPKCAGYRFYGARGVTVCEESLADRGSFFAWAQANGYREGLQIDGTDGTKGYAPDNCRWVSQIDNQNNRRSNRWLTSNGETLTIAQWSRKTGIPHNVIHARLNAGRSADEALFLGHLPARCRPPSA